MNFKLLTAAAAVVFAICVGVLQDQPDTEQPAKAKIPRALSADDDENTVDDPEKEKNELAMFMRKKLGASNRIMEGLCVDDMALVKRGAADLLKMSDAERWRLSNDMMYLHHSREFRRAVETLEDKADRNNIDGAALAWMDVTMSCIRCHGWVRDTMLADDNLKPRPDDFPTP